MSADYNSYTLLCKIGEFNAENAGSSIDGFSQTKFYQTGVLQTIGSLDEWPNREQN